MKQVVGSLKIDMAQYRELAAFSQFASDLDSKTKAQLDRGLRITEILKQGWDEPVPVAEQVVLFYAVSNGYVDSIKLNFVKEWEKAFLGLIREKYPKVLESIVKEKKLTDETINTLNKIIQEFNQSHPEWQLE